MVKYGLNIVFYMKSYPQFELEEAFKFELKNLKFNLTKLNEIKGSYSIIIEPIDDMDQAKKILSKVKMALIMFVLEYNWVAIEIDEEIKNAAMLDEPKYISEDFLVSGSYNINETTIFPLVSDLALLKSYPLRFKNYLDENKLAKKIDNVFSLDYDEIRDEKLSLALEMYLKLSQFSRKRQFLDLVTILEILKPEYSVSNESLDVIKSFKTDLKTLRKTFDKNSEEYLEFDRYLNDMHFWETKSINKSLQQFVKEHEDEFVGYGNLSLKIKNAYSIRSNIVHEGVIGDDFDNCFDFLKDFVGEFLKVMLKG